MHTKNAHAVAECAPQKHNRKGWQQRATERTRDRGDVFVRVCMHLVYSLAEAMPINRNQKINKQNHTHTHSTTRTAAKSPRLRQHGRTIEDDRARKPIIIACPTPMRSHARGILRFATHDFWCPTAECVRHNLLNVVTHHVIIGSVVFRICFDALAAALQHLRRIPT